VTFNAIFSSISLL